MHTRGPAGGQLPVRPAHSQSTHMNWVSIRCQDCIEGSAPNKENSLCQGPVVGSLALPFLNDSLATVWYQSLRVHTLN